MIKRLLYFSISLVFASNILAQDPTFQTSSSTYSAISAGEQIYKDTIWDDLDFDNPKEALHKLGFNFVWKGNTYDSVEILDGLIAFENSSNSGSLVFGAFADLVDRGYEGNSGSKSPIFIKRVGSSPNASLEIEWRNAGFYDQYDTDTTLPDSITMKIVIHEKSSMIDAHIGPNSLSAGPLPTYLDYISFGALETSNTGSKNFYLEGDPSSPSLTSDDNTLGLDNMPSSGRKYTFTFSQTLSLSKFIHTDQELFYTGNKILNTKLKQAPIQIYSMTGHLIESGLIQNYSYTPKNISSGYYVALVTLENKPVTLQFLK